MLGSSRRTCSVSVLDSLRTLWTKDLLTLNQTIFINGIRKWLCLVDRTFHLKSLNTKQVQRSQAFHCCPFGRRSKVLSVQAIERLSRRSSLTVPKLLFHSSTKQLILLISAYLVHGLKICETKETRHFVLDMYFRPCMK
jgi:hypothetical protein